MQKLFFSFSFLFVLSFYSCGQNSNYGQPVEAQYEILENFTNFWAYYNQEVKLSEDFISLDTSSKVMAKNDFLKKVATGQYLPLRLTASRLTYKLIKIDITADKDITNALKDIGEQRYKYFCMENKPLPLLNYTDLKGNHYNPKTVSGKIVVIKCWFIKCQVCVEEMPMLNKLVNSYQSRNDIVFVSLAFDKEDELKKFLTKTQFDWPVVANQTNYLINSLNITSYPAHIIINKKGLVERVVDSYGELESILKKEALK